jgi:hypothetical protein
LPVKGSHEDEMMLLEAGTNGKKKLIWHKDRIFDPKKMQKAINGQKVKMQSEEREGYDARGEAMKAMRNLMLAIQYQQIATVETTMKTQATRAAKMLDHLERVVIDPVWQGYQRSKNDDPNFVPIPYKSQDLKDKWVTFIKAKGIVATTKADEALGTWIKKFEEEVKTLADKREASKTEDNSDPPEEEDERKFREGVEAMRTKVDAIKGKWSNPFATWTGN